MAKFIFGMNQSLDGFVDHEAFGPDEALFLHFVELMQGLAGSIYGRHLYEIMRYWDTDDPGWTTERRAFALAWRRQPKWVVSRTLTSVGPNATLIADDIEARIRDLKSDVPGEIEVGGPVLARSFAEWGLIDEYHVYVHAVVLGGGTPLFAGFRPQLRLVASDRIGGQAVRLTCVPA